MPQKVDFSENFTNHGQNNEKPNKRQKTTI